MTDPIRLLLTLNHIPGIDPELFAANVKRILVSDDYDHDSLDVAIYEPDVTAAGNAAKLSDYDQLTDEQKNLVGSVRWLLSDRGVTNGSDYRRALVEMLAVELFADDDETARVERIIDPWPVVDDVTLATFGHLVVEILRKSPLDLGSQDRFALVRNAARDLNIVFTA